MNEATKEFLETVPSMGGCLVSECACGRTHFATGWYEAGELERTRKIQGKHPDLYVEHDSDSVYVATLAGLPFVVDCGCGKLAAIERRYWQLKDPLLAYYRRRIDKERREASSTDEALKALSV